MCHVTHMCDRKDMNQAWRTWRLHVTHMNKSCRTYQCVTSHIWIRRLTDTGWRRPIGCLKLQVIFAKEPLIVGLFCGNWPINLTVTKQASRKYEVCHTLKYEWVMSRIRTSSTTNMNVSFQTYACDMSRTWMSHVTLRYMKESCHTRKWVTSHIWTRSVALLRIWMRQATHMKESWHTYEWVIAHIYMNES